MNIATHEFIRVASHGVSNEHDIHSIGRSSPQIARRAFETTKHGTLDNHDSYPTQNKARRDVIPFLGIVRSMTVPRSFLSCALEIHWDEDFLLLSLPVLIELGLLDDPFLVGVVLCSLCHILKERPRDYREEDTCKRKGIRCDPAMENYFSV